MFNEQVQRISIAAWIVANGTLVMEFLGTLAFAFSGLLEAARKKFDVVGMAVVAALTAFGGGTLRDILLDRRPFFWVQNEFYIWGILILSLALLIFVSRTRMELTERVMQWPDAIGLGIFAASGTHLALVANMPPIIAVIMGVITSIFGGVARDVAVNQIPRAFSDHQPYAVIAFAGGWVVVILDLLNFADWLTVLVAAAAMIVVRLLAIIYGWRVPAWRA